MNNIRDGMVVVCRDDEHVQNYVQKNKLYEVEAVAERGALVSLKNVPIRLASSRFSQAWAGPSNPTEMASASSQ